MQKSFTLVTMCLIVSMLLAAACTSQETFGLGRNDLDVDLVIGPTSTTSAEVPAEPGTEAPLPTAVPPEAVAQSPVPPTPDSLSGLPAEAFVANVTDGDTINITGRIPVGMIGIDTPETVAPNQPVGCYGPEATDRMIELVEGKTVRLEKDVNETDPSTGCCVMCSCRTARW
jgi:endonuclease YncB( thermonuclease family)